MQPCCTHLIKRGEVKDGDDTDLPSGRNCFVGRRREAQGRETSSSGTREKIKTKYETSTKDEQFTFDKPEYPVDPKAQALQPVCRWQIRKWTAKRQKRLLNRCSPLPPAGK